MHKLKPVSSQVDFPALEKELLDYWYKEGIVEKYLEKNEKSDKKFSFLDGPITANNPMGVHHAWGRTYKDLWQRFFNMRGFKERFQNGFDEQGLWVEVEVEKELGLKNKKEIENLVAGDQFKSLEKFINLCKERVKKYSAIQTEQSRRLGYFMDWDNSYHTSSDENNYAIWNYLKTVYKKGWLYKGRDSVPWCPRCGTAISQHEILTEEYQELTHTSIFFKLPVKNKNLSLLIWTTTPWTIPANVAVAVDTDFNYSKYRNDETGEEVVFLKAKELYRKPNLKMPRILKPGIWKEVKKYKGSDLVGLEYEGPFDHLTAVKSALGNYRHRVIATNSLVLPISVEEGTGLVHIAPGCGSEDFALSRKEGLPVVAPIDEGANYVDGFDFLTRQNVKDVTDKIIDYLDKNGFLFKIEQYTHRYPTCWRCRTELVWRVVDEWYIAMDKVDDSKKTYRDQMKEVAKKINWIPKWGLDRELDWLKNMHDWLISKKRYWGLALPIWECQKCGNFEVIGSREELEEKAIEGWDKFKGNSPHRPWLDQIKIKCSKCQEVISRIPDVGNPWLDAGIVPFSTMPEDWFPADFITEGFPGQFKNWFYSLIAMSTALKNTNPFQNLLGFANVVDEKGEPMHKSKGNAIEFNDAADKIGADVMRWLYLRTNPEHNVLFGYKVTDELRQFFHLRLWNVYAFFVLYANMDSWDDKGVPEPSNDIDKWILSRLVGNMNNINGYVEDHLDKGLTHYNAYDAIGNAEIFINDLSTWYVRRVRNRVNPLAPNGKDKTDVYRTLWYILTEYSKVLAPFIPFIADHIYTSLTEEESVHLAEWPIKKDPVKSAEPYDPHNFYNPDLEKDMEHVQKAATDGHARRKEKGIKLRQPLSQAVYKFERRLRSGLEQILQDELNIKKLEFKKGSAEIKVEIDTEITPDLAEEGLSRDMIRNIQQERKVQNLTLADKTQIFAPSWPKTYEGNILAGTASVSITKADEFKVVKVENENSKRS